MNINSNDEFSDGLLMMWHWTVFFFFFLCCFICMGSNVNFSVQCDARVNDDVTNVKPVPVCERTQSLTTLTKISH